MSPKTASEIYELSLTKLLLGFMKFANKRGEKNFPPFESRHWHDFLYLIKSFLEKSYPELHCIGAFDWDGEYPKCRDFSVAMFGLRYKCFSQTPGGRVLLNGDVRCEKENDFESHFPRLIAEMLRLARTIPGFF